MKLHIHFFNVQHGDSIILELEDTPSKYIVIDSSLKRNEENTINPAYEFLISKGVESISALVITHFDRDHFEGVELILNNFTIERLIIPPIFSDKTEIYKEQLKVCRKKIIKASEKSSDSAVLAPVTSIAELIRFITRNKDKVEPWNGPHNNIFFRDWPNSPQFSCVTYLPLAVQKGKMYERFLDGDIDLIHDKTMNDFSLVLGISFYGHKILLTGDSTIKQWREHEIRMNKSGINNLDYTFFKAPHHGSKHENKKALYSYVLKESADKKHIFISANGIKHPHQETYRIIEEMKIEPYCTNLSPSCAPLIEEINQYKEIPKEFHSFIASYTVSSSPVECQGDITLSLESTDDYTITSSTGLPCVYREL